MQERVLRMLQGIAEAVYVNRVVLRNHPGPAFVQLFANLDRNHTKKILLAF